MANSRRVLPDLAALKAQLDAANARVALLEASKGPVKEDTIELSDFTDSKGNTHQMVAFKMAGKMPFSLSLNKARTILANAKKVHDLIKDL